MRWRNAPGRRPGVLASGWRCYLRLRPSSGSEEEWMATSDAVIVIFLRGGADGLSLIPPIGDDDYYRTRPGLAIEERDAIPLDGPFALHPALGPPAAPDPNRHLPGF